MASLVLPVTVRPIAEASTMSLGRLAPPAVTSRSPAAQQAGHGSERQGVCSYWEGWPPGGRHTFQWRLHLLTASHPSPTQPWLTHVEAAGVLVILALSRRHALRRLVAAGAGVLPADACNGGWWMGEAHGHELIGTHGCSACSTCRHVSFQVVGEAGQPMRTAVDGQLDMVHLRACG